MNAFFALFNPATGRLDAVRVADALNLSVATIASGVGWTEDELRLDPDALACQGFLGRIVAIWLSVADPYAGNEANAHTFLLTSNDHLEGRSPASLIETGELAPLEALMESMTLRQPI
jgi:hypothetical protein